MDFTLNWGDSQLCWDQYYSTFQFNDLAKGIDWLLIIIGNERKLEGQANTQNKRMRFQSKQDSLENWSEKSRYPRYKRENCKDLYLERRNVGHAS